jgi:hypothetical protein
VSEADGSGEVYTCERCGKVRPRTWTCDCGGQAREQKAPAELPDWDPATTRTPRSRLRLVARPEPPDQPA